MRRKSRLPPKRGFRSSDWMRLLSLLMMLAVLYLLWDWARTPNTWRWLADDAGTEESGQPRLAPSAKPEGVADRDAKVNAGESADDSAIPEQPSAEPVATGPTDEGPEEQAAVREEFQAVTDKTLGILPEEMFAYRRVVQWVVHQPASVLRKRARTDLTFHDFMTSPDKHRGELVEMVLDARMVRATEFRAENGPDLFEVWGFTADSGTWLYDTIVLGLPEGMPLGARVNERVRFVGYFFKLQGYHEAGAKPHAPPLAAPMLIGRLIWIQAPPQPPSAHNADWSLGLLVGFALLVGLYVLWHFVRPKRVLSSARLIGRTQAGAPTIDEWLDQHSVDDTADDDE